MCRDRRRFRVIVQNAHTPSVRARIHNRRVISAFPFKFTCERARDKSHRRRPRSYRVRPTFFVAISIYCVAPNKYNIRTQTAETCRKKSTFFRRLKPRYTGACLYEYITRRVFRGLCKRFFFIRFLTQTEYESYLTRTTIESNFKKRLRRYCE